MAAHKLHLFACLLLAGPSFVTPLQGVLEKQWVFKTNSDPCNGVFSTEATCDANAACTWCKSAAVPSACYTTENAKRLPSGVFTCDAKPQVQAPPGANLAMPAVRANLAMPAVNLGHPDDGKTNMTQEALLWFKLGGRGIDTAYVYHNQDEVGAAVRESGLKREEVYITSKIMCPFIGHPTVESTVKAVQEDLKELRMDYVDLMLIHFPCSSHQDTQTVWRGLEQVFKQGLVRAVGVSNFGVDDLDAVLSLNSEVPVAMNQCQMSIGSHDDAVINYCKSKGVPYEAYSPLRHVNLKDPTLVAIAANHKVSPAQVALRWINQQEIYIATSPGGSTEYAKEDLSISSFTLSTNEMAKLSAIKANAQA